MKAILQRVSRANVSVNGREIARTGRGLLILVGSRASDGESQAHSLVEKIAHLRIFEDSAGKMNLSILDTGGEALVVSQFTLYADTSRGRRPSFTDAAPPEQARPLIDHFVEMMRSAGIPTQTGEFGAHMLVELVNNGPVTIILEN